MVACNQNGNSHKTETRSGNIIVHIVSGCDCEWGQWSKTEN